VDGGARRRSPTAHMCTSGSFAVQHITYWTGRSASTPGRPQNFRVSATTSHQQTSVIIQLTSHILLFSHQPMDRESRLQLAIRAVRTEECKSIREAAKLFDISRSTLQDRLNGRQDNQTAKQPFQRFSVEEEASIKRCILQMSSWGWPMTIEAINALAGSLLQKKGDREPLGHNWYKHFLSRHPTLKTHRSRTLDQSRKDASEYTILQE
jgi:hypothetical protein